MISAAYTINNIVFVMEKVYWEYELIFGVIFYEFHVSKG